MGFTADGLLSKKTCSGPGPPDVVLLYFRDNTCLGSETRRQMWHKQKCQYFRWRMLRRRMKVGRENDAGAAREQDGEPAEAMRDPDTSRTDGCWI